MNPYLKICLLSAGLSFLSGCLVDDTKEASVESPPTVNDDNELSSSDTALVRTLSALSTNIFSQNITQLQTDNTLLTTAVNQYCSALATNSTETASALQEAQAAWSRMMSTWQRLSAAPIEPITDNGNRLGGRIYSWPDQVSTCTLDTQIVIAQTADNYDISSAPRQSRGLDALEYLLFNPDLTSTCPTLIPETNIWNALSEDDKRTQRCDYALLIANDLTTHTDELSESWQSYQPNFTEFGSNARFEDPSAAVNQITDALFYLDTETKDRKLAAVLGIENGRGTCGNNACPEFIESPWSNSALTHIRDNLLGFRQAFIATLTPRATSAGEQVGFDYQLTIRNFPDLAETLLQRTDVVIDFLNDYSRTFDAAIANLDNTACLNASSNPGEQFEGLNATDGTELCALHGILKSITDLLKTDFLTLMTLSLPERVEGDND